MELFEFKVDDITEHDAITNFVDIVIKARNEAIQRGIKANSIVINKNMVFVPGDYELYPTMVCGLDVYVTKDELPDGYSFAVVESQREKTNADRIRAMSDEELAKILYNHQVCYIRAKRRESCSEYGCEDCLLEWLKQPAEEA